ncbi:MAG: aminodeoxychorismate/anthranilate synthase component II [Alphaproteobacteria bacterium]|nr:aminodeoxychorismate/anthranilate synthase component II [Alphaproteobacteria bacterium]
MFLVIDNYDSFVHNLARYFEIAEVETQLVRNDAITLDEIENMAPDGIILSPGPCTPQDAGICIETVKKFGQHIPILGVCLGHQAIGEAYGATTIRAEKCHHGKASTITHDGTSLFAGIPSPMTVGRYHSLIVEPNGRCPLQILSTTDDGEIMAFKHPAHPVYGVQFHPESVLTQHGQAMIENFVDIALQHSRPQKYAA